MSIFNYFFKSDVEDDTIKILSPSEFKDAIQDKNVQLLDVRTSNEYAQGTIKDAVNLDFFQSSKFKNGIQKLDKTKPVYLFCRSGNRSQKAARILKSEGFKEVYDLKGGITRY